MLQGELDWVVMKALEKDRNRRYDTANGLARDLQRYLADEVVEARPPSRGYRLRKFVRRNKIQVIAATLVFVTLVGGVVGTSLGMYSARKAQAAEAKQRGIADEERDKAVAAGKKTAFERDRAVLANARTSAIDSFLTNDLLTQAEPEQNAEEDKVTLLEVLDRAAEKVGTRFTDRPELEEYLRWVIAGVYHGLASYEKAEAQTRALLAVAKALDPESAEVYKYQGFLAHLLWHRGKMDPDVLKSAEEAVRGLERTLGPDHEDALSAMNELAFAYDAMGKKEEAIAFWERVRDSSITKRGFDDVNTLRVLGNLAAAYHEANRPDKAVPLFEEVVKRQEVVRGREHLDTQITRANLGYIYLRLNRPKDAVPLLEIVYKGSAKHPHFRGIAPVLIDAYRNSGQAEKALPLLEEKAAESTAEQGPDDPQTLHWLQVLATAYREAGKLDRSLPIYEDLLKRREAKLGRKDRATQTTAANLGSAYVQAGRPGDGIPLLEEARESAKQFPDLGWVNGDLIGAYEKAGEKDKLVDFLRRWVDEARETLPIDSRELAGRLARAGGTLLGQQKWTEAEPYLRETSAILEKIQPDAWTAFNMKSMLGGALLGQKKYADAEPLLMKGYEGMKARETTIPPPAAALLPEALDRLIELYTATGRLDEAEKWRAERAKYPTAAAPPSETK